MHGGHTSRRAHHIRWNTKTLDRDLFGEILTWMFEGGLPAESIDGSALRIAGMMSTACDVSTRRLRFFNNKRGVYWWNEVVAHARRHCVAVRRMLTRWKRRGGRCEDLAELYRRARSDLCKSIKKAKSEAWGALIQTLDENPWGLLYRVVMNRLRRSGPTLSEMLEPVEVKRLLNNLFPSGEVHNPTIHGMIGRFLMKNIRFRSRRLFVRSKEEGEAVVPPLGRMAFHWISGGRYVDACLWPWPLSFPAA